MKSFKSCLTQRHISVNESICLHSTSLTSLDILPQNYTNSHTLSLERIRERYVTYLMLFFTLFRVSWLKLNLLLENCVFMCHSLEIALEISDHLLRLTLFLLPPLQFVHQDLGHLLSIDILWFKPQVFRFYELLLALLLIQSLSQLLVLLGQLS